ncbi:chemotaxis protein [Azovibrio restrictus]|uniref:chemotaxis protein n=1 Tax=Azovibrio restrictus TaxID=146938 RepID=UPI0026EEA692|nr:chemotaxis protein [Azovibrio restrictus]
MIPDSGTTPRSLAHRSAGQDLVRIVQINEEIKSIVAVAFKINIMALNAIFLAKRAGSTALGFGVLSNELRVFSQDLKNAMGGLSGVIHKAVSDVSVLLQDQRMLRLLQEAEVRSGGNIRVREALRARYDRMEAHRANLALQRRQLQLVLGNVAQLVELGGVLAKSAKIEAAYGQAFSSSLSQVSGEFDGVVEEIRRSLGHLNKSEFFSSR